MQIKQIRELFRDIAVIFIILLAVKALVSMPDKKIILPEKIFALVNEEINIYYTNVVEDEYLNKDYKYWIKYTGSGGVSEQLENRFRIIPEKSGSFVLTFQVFKDGKCIEKKEAIVEVSDVISGGEEKNVLVIGDSTIANGFMLSKWEALAEDKDSAINFIGTKGDNLKHEGISGWTAIKFASDEESPFVFQGVLDFGRYIKENHLADPDYVCINLGINDVFLAKNDKELKDRMKGTLEAFDQLIESIRKYDSEIVIGINIPIPPTESQDAFGKANVGQTQWRYKMNIQAFQKKIIERYRGICDVIPIYVNLDTENAMGKELCQINARDFRYKIEVPANGHVHPDDIGYAQIADEMWAWYNWRLQDSIR